MKFYGKNCSTCSANYIANLEEQDTSLKGNGRKVKNNVIVVSTKKKQRREILD